MGRVWVIPAAVTSERRVQPFEQLIEEGAALVVLRIGRVRQRDAKSEDVLRPEAGVDARELREAAQEERGADEQHDGHRDFGDQEAASHPPSARRRRRSSALLEHRANRAARRLPRGREAEEDACREGDAKREEQHRQVDRDVGRARNAARAQRLDRTNGQIREQEPDGAAGQGQDDAFGEHLQDEPAAAGAESRADRDLFPADRRAHQQQVGDVRARDQDDHADGREEREQRRADPGDHVLLQADDLGGFAGAGLRVLNRQPFGDPLHLGAGLLHGDARLEAAR